MVVATFVLIAFLLLAYRFAGADAPAHGSSLGRCARCDGGLDPTQLHLCDACAAENARWAGG